jgi:hypothetical protein
MEPPQARCPRGQNKKEVSEALAAIPPGKKQIFCLATSTSETKTFFGCSFPLPRARAEMKTFRRQSGNRETHRLSFVRHQPSGSPLYISPAGKYLRTLAKRRGSCEPDFPSARHTQNQYKISIIPNIGNSSLILIVVRRLYCDKGLTLVRVLFRPTAMLKIYTKLERHQTWESRPLFSLLFEGCVDKGLLLDFSNPSTQIAAV